MMPPREYFERCNSDDPGAQRVGAEWFRFCDNACLALWLAEIDELRDSLREATASLEAMKGASE